MFKFWFGNKEEEVKKAPEIGSLWKYSEDHLDRIRENTILDHPFYTSHDKARDCSKSVFIVVDVKGGHVLFTCKDSNLFEQVTTIDDFYGNFEEYVKNNVDEDDSNRINNAIEEVPFPQNTVPDVDKEIIAQFSKLIEETKETPVKDSVVEFDYENGEVILYLNVGNLPRHLVDKYTKDIIDNMQKFREKKLRMTVIPVKDSETRMVFINPKGLTC